MSAFLGYVEIRTKITSIFAFLITIAFLFFMGQSINWSLTSIFFVSMFLFDLTTTAINNYIDTKGTDQILQFDRKIALAIIFILLGVSVAFGLLLVYLTDVVVFLIGGLCFMCGILYTYGPIPISRQPWGELLSGIFYGLLIPFLILYLNMPEGTYLTMNLDIETISITVRIMPIITVILFSIIPICTTTNIMLANNICDLEKDIKVKRYTLPYYLGDNALNLFAGIYYMTYLATIIMVALKILSPICLISILTIYIVQKNIKQFKQIQDKGTTFILSIKNYIIIMGTNTLMIFISGMLT